MLVERARRGRYTVRPDADRGLDYLEQKLGLFIQGPSQTRRNAALDLLTGRVTDERLVTPEATKPSPPHPPTSLPVPVPPTRTHPTPAYRPARVVRVSVEPPATVEATSRVSASPWLAPRDAARPRFRIEHAAPPAASRWPLRRVLLLAIGSASVVLVAGV